MVWQAYLFMEAELKTLNDRLAIAPDDIELRFNKAAVLNKLGRSDEARNAYLELLALAPTHFGALNNLGALLTATGFLTAARTAFAEAVKHHPENPTAHAHLANSLAKNGQIDLARMHFETALRLAPDHPEANQGFSMMLTELGDEESARKYRIKGFQQRPIMTVPYRGKEVPIAVLMLASALGGAVPIQGHLDDRIFFTTVIIVDFFDPEIPLPPHQVVFNAVGDADICQTSLEAAARILRRTDAPVINDPAAVLMTGRAKNAERLGVLTGIITPKTAVFPRESLSGPDASVVLADRGIIFPFLLRSPGFHTGKNFERIESAEDLASILPQLPGTELMAIECLDARGPDGKYRKYRVMMIDGQLFPMHAAVSHHWKVHYFTADMAENLIHRFEDEKFLNRMDDVLGPRALQTLRQIYDALGLEYAGIDFGLNSHGDVLLFEANATMVVNPPEPDPRWDYRRVPVQRILDAIRKLFTKRVTPGDFVTAKTG